MRATGYSVGILAWALLAGGCAHLHREPYPLGIYSVPQSDLPTVARAGISLVTGPATQAYLDAAEGLGLKVLAAPGTTAGTTFNADQARRMVSRFDQHPGLWAWYLVDEPDLAGVSPSDVKRAHQFLKNVGARKPTVLVLFQGGEALNYGEIADVTMIDRYPIPWLPLANFPQHVRMARLGVRKNKPLIAVVQAFDWSYYPKLLAGQKDLRPPTYAELRCMSYCALARGANGLFYYCYDDGAAWKMTEHPAVWEDLKRVVEEINARRPLFEAQPVWWPYVHEFGDPSSGFNAALESSVIPALLRVRRTSRGIAAGDYLLAVNNTDRQLTYWITLPGGNDGKIAALGEDRTVAVADGWLEDEFGPFDVHIYGPIRGKGARKGR